MLVITMVKRYNLYIMRGNNKKLLISSNKIIDIDRYSKDYIGSNHLLYMNNSFNKGRLVLINSNSNLELPIVYAYDYGYINNYNIKDMYYNYLIRHRNYICDSLVKYVKIDTKIDRNISDNLLEVVCDSYFKKHGYKALRDAYYELISFGIIKMITSIEKENPFDEEFIPSSGDDYLNSLIENRDYDSIYNLYDIDDMPRDIYQYVSGSKRLLKRR